MGKGLVELREDKYIDNSGKYDQVFLYARFKFLNLFIPLPCMYCPPHTVTVSMF